MKRECHHFDETYINGYTGSCENNNEMTTSSGTSDYNFNHYNDVIMGAIVSPTIGLTIVYSIVYLDADERKHQAPRHWPLCGEFTGTGEFPAQMASNAENVSIWWRYHVKWLFRFRGYGSSKRREIYITTQTNTIWSSVWFWCIHPWAGSAQNIDFYLWLEYHILMSQFWSVMLGALGIGIVGMGLLPDT